MGAGLLFLFVLIIGNAGSTDNKRHVKSQLSQRILNLCEHIFDGLKKTILLISKDIL